MIERVIELNGQDINEWKSLGGGVMARRYNTIGTSIVKYGLYIALDANNRDQYQTTTTHEGSVYGDFSTWNRIAGLELTQVGTPSRCKLVDEHYAHVEEVVKLTIEFAFPNDFKKEEKE